ncbi:hypothetical protein PPROV_000787800 [Pycnococcus provasolii]|uniref:50S ribosomal protein L22, chloroplastic n=1 Tax=Pycnococcus provasolii TaxID=41880 RepID=A0A830HUH2_9CHLO|nr:hypothetical protein PPROV_000787800 [Pycnococcus provasolii]
MAMASVATSMSSLRGALGLSRVSVTLSLGARPARHLGALASSHSLFVEFSSSSRGLFSDPGSFLQGSHAQPFGPAFARGFSASATEGGASGSAFDLFEKKRAEEEDDSSVPAAVKQARAKGLNPATSKFGENRCHAVLRNAHMGKKKVAFITRLLHGFTADEAMMHLQAMAVTKNLKAAKMCVDLLKSAIHNGTHNHGYDPRRLVVQRAFVSPAKTAGLKYPIYHARGRTGMGTKGRCHITIELEHYPADKPLPRPKIRVVWSRPEDRYAMKRPELMPQGGWKQWKRERRGNSEEVMAYWDRVKEWRNHQRKLKLVQK